MLPLLNASRDEFSPRAIAKQELERLQERLREYERMYTDVNINKLRLNENTQMTDIDREEQRQFNAQQAENRKQMILKLKNNIKEKKAELKKLQKSDREKRETKTSKNKQSNSPHRFRSSPSRSISSRSPSRSRL